MAQEATAAHHDGEHEDTTTGLNHRKMLMWAFLGSDCMFFGTLIATYLVYFGRSKVGPFPEDVFSIPVTSVSTFVLLMSSMSMVLAYAALTRGSLKTYRVWLMSTIIMGATFLGFPSLRVLRVRQPRGPHRLQQIPGRAGRILRHSMPPSPSASAPKAWMCTTASTA